MTPLLRALQLALAALLASAGGGLVLVLLASAAAIAAGAAEGGATLAAAPAILAIAFFGAGLAIGPAVGTAWLPAFAVGSALWLAGRSREWPRRRLAWALGGAAAASACWLRVSASGTPASTSFGLLELPGPALAALFLLAGAVAGQLFRSALAATTPFFGFEEHPESE